MTMPADVREVSQNLPLSANAVVVLKRRYLKKDDKGEVAEGAPDMFRRVAETIAEKDRLYDPDADVAATAKKLDISFYHYIHDRISRTNQIPSLADLVSQRAKDLNLGWSFT